MTDTSKVQHAPFTLSLGGPGSPRVFMTESGEH